VANNPEIIEIALETGPEQVTLVPEKREEVTTEGGLDVRGNLVSLRETVKKFDAAGILVSFFIDPVEEQLASSRDCGARFVELHTGSYANTGTEAEADKELDKLTAAALAGGELGLRVNAGHGLNYLNVKPVRDLPHLEELHIGHSIVSRAVFVGLEKAVKEMADLIAAPRG